MRPASTRLRAGLLATCTALGALATIGPASADASSATQLAGDWAPFSRCPVDDPAMLAADGRTDIVQCIASHSASGTIKLGNTNVVTGASDLQVGVVQHTGGTNSLVAPAGGALIAKIRANRGATKGQQRGPVRARNTVPPHSPVC
ncbi:hypothetical protein AB0C89_21000, partial [Streptomyces sp. NPDC048491]